MLLEPQGPGAWSLCWGTACGGARQGGLIPGRALRRVLCTGRSSVLSLNHVVQYLLPGMAAPASARRILPFLPWRSWAVPMGWWSLAAWDWRGRHPLTPLLWCSPNAITNREAARGAVGGLGPGCSPLLQVWGLLLGTAQPVAWGTSGPQVVACGAWALQRTYAQQLSGSSSSGEERLQCPTSSLVLGSSGDALVPVVVSGMACPWWDGAGWL